MKNGAANVRFVPEAEVDNSNQCDQRGSRLAGLLFSARTMAIASQNWLS